MTNPSSKNIESVRQFCQVAARKCGLDVQCAITDLRANGEFCVSIEHNTTDLSFEVLVKLSKVLATENMTLSCDLGTGSDHSHNPSVCITWQSFEQAFHQMDMAMVNT